MFKNRIITLSVASGGDNADVFCCSQCKALLFSAHHKFDSKTGFPSFWAHEAGSVQQQPLQTYGRHRVQVLCQQCGQHLGHLFPDPRTPSQVRYCINAGAIARQPPEEF